MKKRFITLIMSLLVLALLVVGCSSVEVASPEYKYDYKGYLDYNFSTELSSQEISSFTFKYPQGWVIEESPFRPATESVEASPDWGVEIYKKDDKENSIFIFASFSPWSLGNEEDYEKSEFIVEGHKKADIQTFIKEGTRYTYILYEEPTMNFQNASITMEEDFYKQHKEEIWHILASVEY